LTRYCDFIEYRRTKWDYSVTVHYLFENFKKIRDSVRSEAMYVIFKPGRKPLKKSVCLKVKIYVTHLLFRMAVDLHFRFRAHRDILSGGKTGRA
jgi:hypothetical protein